jgi:hypothetical protein
LQSLIDNTEFEKKVLEDESSKKHETLNFYLPHELGGCGQPIQKELYGLFNIFTPDMDVATIKPRWTTKHEFKVDLPKNKLLDGDPEVEDLEMNEPSSSLNVQGGKTNLNLSKRYSIASVND